MGTNIGTGLSQIWSKHSQLVYITPSSRVCSLKSRIPSIHYLMLWSSSRSSLSFLLALRNQCPLLRFLFCVRAETKQEKSWIIFISFSINIFPLVHPHVRYVFILYFLGAWNPSLYGGKHKFQLSCREASVSTRSYYTPSLRLRLYLHYERVISSNWCFGSSNFYRVTSLMRCCSSCGHSPAVPIPFLWHSFCIRPCTTMASQINYRL